MEEVPEKKKLVLLVDDDQFLLDMYRLKFRNSGFEVETADTAENALKKLRDGLLPDIILVDIVMPTMDGLEFVKRVRAEGLAPAASLVMLTNQGQPGDIDKATASGAQGYIVKAATVPSEVVEEVKAILAKRK